MIYPNVTVCVPGFLILVNSFIRYSVPSTKLPSAASCKHTNSYNTAAAEDKYVEKGRVQPMNIIVAAQTATTMPTTKQPKL